MDHDAALDEIFGGDGEASEVVAAPPRGAASSLEDVFEELERGIVPKPASGGVAASPAAAGSPSPTAAAPQGALSPARPAVVSSPLQLATAAIALPLPVDSTPTPLTPLMPWMAEDEARLSALLLAAPVDASAVAAACLAHLTVPARLRAGVWSAVLDAVSPPAPPPSPGVVETGSGSGASPRGAGEGAQPLSPQPRYTKLRADPGEIERITAEVSSRMSAGPGPAPLLPPSALARVVSSFCTTRMVPYSTALAALACPLAWVTADANEAFMLLYALAQLFAPSLFSLSVEGWAKAAASSEEEAAGPGYGLPEGISASHGRALHALVAYHEPELSRTLDAACPEWWHVAGSVGADGMARGALPAAWWGSVYAGVPGTSPATVLLLWDRLILSSFALQGLPGGCSDALAWPLTPLGSSVVALGAALVTRESVALRVVCRTSSAVRTLLASTLDAGLKRTLKGNGEAELAVSTTAWLNSAASLLAATPQSFGVASAIDAPPPSVGGVRMSPAEVLPQVVYSWQRILAAVGAVPADVRAAASAPLSRSCLLPCTTSPTRPLHVLMIDVRPVAHRQAGRLATAYHIDPASIEVSLPGWGEGRRAGVEAVEDEVAGAGTPMGPASPTPSYSSSYRAGLAGDEVSGDDAAWGVRGVPLPTALGELRPLSGKLHIVVMGVGTRVIRGAYAPATLPSCAVLDDERVGAVVRALRKDGFRYVSTLEGGFAALHGSVRNRAMHAPPLLPALRPDGTYSSSSAPSAGAAYDISLFVPSEDAHSSLKACLVDHAPRSCPSCRHAAVERLFARTIGLAAAASPRATLSLPARVEDLARATASMLDGWADSAAAAVSSLREDLGVTPSALTLPTSGELTSARDAALRSILVAVREGGITARAGLAALAADIAVAAERAKETISTRGGEGKGSAEEGARASPTKTARTRAPAAGRSPTADAFSIDGEEEGEGGQARVADEEEEDEFAEFSGSLVSPSRMAGEEEKASPPSRLQALRDTVAEEASRRAGEAREQAGRAKNAIAKALAPPPPTNAAAALAGPQIANVSASIAAVGRSFKAAVSAPPAGNGSVGIPVATVLAHAATAAAPAPAPSINTSALRAGLGRGLAGFSAGFAGLQEKAAEGLQKVQASATAAAAQASAAATAAAAAARAQTGGPAAAAPAPAALPVVLPSMDPLAARLLAGSAKGETLDCEDVRYATGLLVFPCFKDKGGGEGEEGAITVGAGAGLTAATFVPRRLVLAPAAGRLFVLEPHPDPSRRSTAGVVKSNHHVTELGKLSYSKKRPNRITLWYRRGRALDGGGATVDLVPRVYVLEGAAGTQSAGEAFAAALQATVSKAKAGN
jgi:hypothetical protein